MLRDASLIPLSHQHHNGLALCVLIERSLREDPAEENVLRQAARAADRYDLEMANHFEIEEQVLFPALDDPLVEDLISEHRRLTGLAEALRTAPTRAALDEFLALLRAHIRKEENELFERAQKTLDRAAIERLGKEIDARAVRVCL
jgi:hemerythrin-like domain-containing protein